MRSRIYEIVPQRIQQWQQSPCVAEEMGRRQLERIRKEQQAARLRLTLMEKRFHELEGIIANCKLNQVQHDEEVRKNHPGRRCNERMRFWEKWPEKMTVHRNAVGGRNVGLGDLVSEKPIAIEAFPIGPSSSMY